MRRVVQKEQSNIFPSYIYLIGKKILIFPNLLVLIPKLPSLNGISRTANGTGHRVAVTLPEPCCRINSLFGMSALLIIYDVIKLSLVLIVDSC